MIRACIPIALTSLLVAPALARAADAGEYDVAAAFAEADTNGNGAIAIDEYYDRLIEIYFQGDADKDGYLSREELARAVVIPEDFEKADTDHDGKISRREFVRVRLPIFLEVDTDHDGELTLDEVKHALETRGGR